MERQRHEFEVAATAAAFSGAEFKSAEDRSKAATEAACALYPYPGAPAPQRAGGGGWDGATLTPEDEGSIADVLPPIESDEETDPEALLP